MMYCVNVVVSTCAVEVCCWGFDGHGIKIEVSAESSFRADGS